MSKRILFVCTANSARSQMAEGLARVMAAERVEVSSAGTHPAAVNPLAVEAMRERGIDISAHVSKRVDDLRGEFDYVITLCDSAAEACPYLPARLERLHWPFPDPAAAAGVDESARRELFSRVRDAIEARLRQWLADQRLLKE